MYQQYIEVRIQYPEYYRSGKNSDIPGLFALIFPFGKVILFDMKITSAESVSEAVKTRRKQLGLTQSEAAAMCNVGTRFFSELENGKETLQMNKVLHCLEMLGINLYAVNREDDRGENK